MDTKRWRRRLAGPAVLWLVLTLFEIALVGKLDPEETPVGITIALLATCATIAAASAASVRYGFRAGWLWLPILVARNIVRDAFVVYGVVLRRLAGGRVADAYLDVPFEPGGSDPASAARRALAVAAVSTSPNEIVLALDRTRRTMRVHVLVDTGSRRHSAEWPL